MNASQIIWAIIWLLILVFIGFWIAGICSFLYILVSVFTPCLPPLEPIAEILMKGVQFANYCSKNLIKGNSLL
ncbi:hypothetical protein B4U79_07677 [Dinothrombium tinctorium]|uniref:Uncharacterized protein n=1 Tax=Dinothrombium tinctorium TaxID=1965070 RepID=A0A443QN14_9ACAR|nr:hypothetical protein B4U79_07677 [Dinothrombium tinctorium]